MPDPLHPHSPFVAAPCSFGRGESLSVLRGAFFIPATGHRPHAQRYAQCCLTIVRRSASHAVLDAPRPILSAGLRRSRHVSFY
ncbi:hypothetical protein BKM03_02085 [Pseudomonas avellanae]|uniref:Uncharacterized protein n=1 Tax=Pseudomonas avellanae TaxID=46257 RepID=A0AAD0GNW5_9PSED|nr:hypothetical protein BKM03_02085 [Pseudomonas avellanae]POP87929.1 hypothetical protein CXB34_05290 [Pseudomonas amygdali pv. morsprunorum]